MGLPEREFTSVHKPSLGSDSVGPWGRGDEPEMDPALEGSAVLGEGGSDSASQSQTRLGPCGEGDVLLWIFTDFLSKPQMPG